MSALFATPEGTARYRDRFPRLREAGHFRQGPGDLWLSSIGLGTYLGEPDERTDAEYTEAIVGALRSGINVLDTAINYRHQRSERNIGAALQQLAGEVSRDEIFISTKAGYLCFDGNMPADPRGYFMREYMQSGILDPTQLAGGVHCMAPAYLGNQIERSRKNLGLETIDLFYLHNPETQLSDISRDAFHDRVRQAFEFLERQVAAGVLRFYGMATWNGFRTQPQSHDHLDLVAIAEIARELAGETHHFRFVQLPFNLAMPEAFGLANQDEGRASLFEAAAELGIAVMGSATLYQGQLTRGLPESLRQVLGMNTDAECAIQFARSAPGIATALIGMAQKEHVRANLKPAYVPPAREEEWKDLFRQM